MLPQSIQAFLIGFAIGAIIGWILFSLARISRER